MKKIITLSIIAIFGLSYLAYANFIVDPASTNYLKAGSLSKGLVGHWSLAKDDTRTGTTNKVTNGTFDSDTAWAKGTGWTISGGTANCDGSQTSQSLLYQTNLPPVGEKVKVTYTVSNYSAGSLKVFTGGGDAGSTPVSANGTYEYVQTVTGGNSTLYFGADADFIGSIDNVTVYDVTGNVVDLTPNNNQGLRVGTTWTTDRHGQSNKALLFNGTSDYIQLPTAFSQSTFTISAWIKTSHFVGTPIIFDARDGSADGFIFFLSAGKPYLNYNNLGTTAGGTINDNTWRHVAVTAQAGGTAQVYVDGVPYGSSLNLTGTINATTNVTIGRESFSSAKFWNGGISDLRFYDRALSQAEVTTLYNTYK
jgi:hypothetical protein